MSPPAAQSPTHPSARSPLYLASTSPRRRQLLIEAGIAFTPFVVLVDEDALTEKYAGPLELLGEYLAQQKALAAAKALWAKGNMSGLVLAADTTVLLDGRSLPKPRDLKEARAMLETLRAREHVVATGIALTWLGSDRIVSDTSATRVLMRDYADEEIARYVATGDPLDKAGAYSIQHPLFAPVERIRGCHLGVIGLPICLVSALLCHAPPFDRRFAPGANADAPCPWSAGCQPPLPSTSTEHTACWTATSEVACETPMTLSPQDSVVRGRYAPSPTGVLHLGNLRTALLAWLFARSAGGSFVLRVEDLDRPRVRPGASTQMLADLRWLGLDWDEGPDVGGSLGPYTQSARQAIYDAALVRLRQKGLLYPCYCTRAELARIASAPHGDEGPRYSGTCRALTQRERRERQAAGRQPALRFQAPLAPISFIDRIAGAVTESVAEAVGDFVVRRSDGIVAYQLAVVVDDALMGITQIVRGADLLSSTARQLALYDALDLPRPHEYAHVPLVLNSTGERMAKREADAGLSALRDSGMKPADVIGKLAASCGFWPSREPASAAQMLAAFDAARLRRQAAMIDVAQLGRTAM